MHEPGRGYRRPGTGAAGAEPSPAEPTARGCARTYTRPLVEEQEEARRFLMARTGGRAEARAHWCAMAGVEAEYLALRVAKLAVNWANSARQTRLGLPPQ